MPQTTVTIALGLKSLAALLLSSSAVTVLGMYLLSRFTQLFDAYAGERAKLLAQFHNLDKLLEQTKLLSATTETIKARISDEIWDRQMKWNFKRDVYIRLMEALGLHMSNHQYNMHLESVRRVDSKNPLFQSVRDEAIRRTHQVQQELVRAACSAPLVVSHEAHKILIDTQRRLGQIDYDAVDFRVDCEKNITVLQDGLDKLSAAARNDLGIDIV